MWCRHNGDTSWTICESFWAVIDGVVTLVDEDYDKRKNPHGFEWKSDTDALISAELEGLK